MCFSHMIGNCLRGMFERNEPLMTVPATRYDGLVPMKGLPPAGMPLSFSPAPRFSTPNEQEILPFVLSRLRALLR